jgi:glycosyltransferase involved in cell wall biosynthesis
VIISAGPGASDVLHQGQAIVVPPQDVEALAEQISIIWQNDSLRRTVAERGYAYARMLQGECRLYADIAREVADVLKFAPGPAETLRRDD